MKRIISSLRTNIETKHRRSPLPCIIASEVNTASANFSRRHLCQYRREQVKNKTLADKRETKRKKGARRRKERNCSFSGAWRHVVTRPLELHVHPLWRLFCGRGTPPYAITRPRSRLQLSLSRFQKSRPRPPSVDKNKNDL